MKEKKENSALHMLKGIAAIMIICVHAPFPGLPGQLIIVYARTGVALFFFISGYYMFSDRKTDYGTRGIKKAINIMRLAIGAYIFYYLFEIVVLITGTGMEAAKEWIFSFFHVTLWLKFFFLQHDMIAGPLWFLNALIVCYYATLVFKEKMFTRESTVIASILLGIHFYIMNILPLFTGKHISMYICRNAWFYGLPVFILGGYLHKQLTEKKITINNHILLSFACGSIIFLAIEYYTIGYSQLYLGNIVLLFTAFIWAIQNEDRDYRNILSFIGKELSMYVYIFHWSVIFVVIKGLKVIRCEENQYLVTLLTIVGTFIISYLIYFFRKGIKKHE